MTLKARLKASVSVYPSIIGNAWFIEHEPSHGSRSARRGT